MPSSPIDPSVIDRAPLEIDPTVEIGSGLDANYVGQLASELEAMQAENERLKAKKSIDDVRAALLEPYVKKIFMFVVWYCSVVGIFLVFAAFKICNFVLPESILAIISGSTAVSVVGLIGLVISGLFGSERKS